MDIFFSQLLRAEYPDVLKPALKIVCDGRIPTRHANAMHVLDYDPNQAKNLAGHEEPNG